MTEQQGDGFNLEDRDRLPWLEPAEEDYVEQGVSPAKIVSLVVLGLGLLALIVGGGYWLKSRGNPGNGDEPRLIAAEGDYKVPVNATDGKSFEGEGDAAYPTSEGAEPAGRIDASKVPETPLPNVSRGSITKEQAAKPDVAPTKGKVVAAVKDETRSSKPVSAAASGAGGGAFIQLGAYGSTAVANDAWKKFAKRFDYLATLGNSVQPVSVGGQTLYRLRAQAPSSAEAASICGKLRVAGESCMVVN